MIQLYYQHGDFVMRKLAFFSVFLALLGIIEVANANFIIQLPSKPTIVKDQNQNDGYVVDNFGQKVVVFCARYNTQNLQDVATKMGAVAYNIKNGSSFPVAANIVVVCKNGSWVTNDTFGLQFNTSNFLSPSADYNITPKSLLPFAVSQDGEPKTTNDVNMDFTYYNGCPESRYGSHDNFYLTSSDQCSNKCPKGAVQKQINISNNITTLIWCDDKSLNDAAKNKKQQEDNSKLEAIKRKCINAGGSWNITKNTCDCGKSGELFWNGSQCVKKSAQCRNETIDWLQSEAIQYSNDKDISSLIEKILDECKENSNNIAQFNLDNDILKLKLLIKKYEDEKTTGVTNSESKIKSFANDINGVMSNFSKKSVWTDKEGNFNKARLVSDSVAGVVLGTAGGLITSSIIKKNQTENGFEDISCTVGGQVVAGWDDEFTVGIK